jgi:hypothetical protein
MLKGASWENIRWVHRVPQRKMKAKEAARMIQWLHPIGSRHGTPVVPIYRCGWRRYAVLTLQLGTSPSVVRFWSFLADFVFSYRIKYAKPGL